MSAERSCRDVQGWDECRAGMSALIEEADSEEEEVWMVGGSPCNELLL